MALYTKRKGTENFLKRWDDFRERKEKAIDAYVKVRKRMYRASSLLEHILFMKYMKIVLQRLNDEKFARKRSQHLVFIRMIWEINFKVHLRRNRGYVNRMKMYVRDGLTFRSIPIVER